MAYNLPNWLIVVFVGGVLFFVYFLITGKRRIFGKAPAKENFVSKTCPDGTRSDGPCLLEFPRF